MGQSLQRNISGASQFHSATQRRSAGGLTSLQHYLKWFFAGDNYSMDYRWREVRLFRRAKKVEDVTVRDSSDSVMQEHPTYASWHIQISPAVSDFKNPSLRAGYRWQDTGNDSAIAFISTGRVHSPSHPTRLKNE